MLTFEEACNRYRRETINATLAKRKLGDLRKKEDMEDQATMDAIEKMFIGHGIPSPGEVRIVASGSGGGGAPPPMSGMSLGFRRSPEFQFSVGAAQPTSTRPIPLSALRHQQQRIGLFVPR
jgi:hypothetical protein